MSCYRQIHSDKHVCCNCEMDVVHVSSIKHVHYTHGERISWTMDKRNILTVCIIPLATRSHYYCHELMVSEKIGILTCRHVSVALHEMAVPIFQSVGHFAQHLSWPALSRGNVVHWLFMFAASSSLNDELHLYNYHLFIMTARPQWITILYTSHYFQAKHC